MLATTFPTTEERSNSASSLTEIRPCLRGDLEIHAEADGGGLLILAAGSAEMKSFSFGPHEFLMVRFLDGKRSLEQIHASLVVQPGLEALAVENVKRHVDWLFEMDLLEVAEIGFASQTPLVTQAEGSSLDTVPDSDSLVGRRSIGRRSISRRVLSGLAQAACVALLVWGAEQALEWQNARSLTEFTDSSEGATKQAEAFSNDRNSGVLVSEFDGVLSELFVRDGDKVLAGEILASIDNLEIRKVLTNLRADLAECQDLRDEAYSEHDWSEYRLQVMEMAEITQRMGQLRFEEEVAQLRAPHAGVIHADKNLSDRVGKIVASGQMLMSVERVDADRAMPYLMTSSVVH